MDGQPISTRYDDRTLGISLAQLCNIPDVIAIAGSDPKYKVHPMLGALRTGCLNVLITDRWTAEAVLVKADLDVATLRYFDQERTS